MNEVSDYQMFQDVQSSLDRIEDKLDARMTRLEGRVDTVEAKTDNLLGKIGIGVIVLSGLISLVFTIIWNTIKQTFK